MKTWLKKRWTEGYLLWRKHQECHEGVWLGVTASPDETRSVEYNLVTIHTHWSKNLSRYHNIDECFEGNLVDYRQANMIALIWKTNIRIWYPHIIGVNCNAVKAHARPYKWRLPRYSCEPAMPLLGFIFIRLVIMIPIQTEEIRFVVCRCTTHCKYETHLRKTAPGSRTRS